MSGQSHRRAILSNVSVVPRLKGTLSVLLILAAFHAVTISATVTPAGVDGGATAVCAARVTVHTSGVRICKPLFLAEPAAVCVAGLADANEKEFEICPPPERSTLTGLQGTPLGSRPPPAPFVAT